MKRSALVETSQQIEFDQWTPSEIRKLRCRLGWSQAELARHLKLEFTTVSAWELGSQPLLAEQCSRLRLIFQQAEVNADRVQRRPIAEAMMKDLGLSQIHDFDVANRHVDAPRKSSIDEPKSEK